MPIWRRWPRRSSTIGPSATTRRALPGRGRRVPGSALEPADFAARSAANGLSTRPGVHVRRHTISPRVTGVYILVTVCSNHIRASTSSAPKSSCTGKVRRLPSSSLPSNAVTCCVHAAKVFGGLSGMWAGVMVPAAGCPGVGVPVAVVGVGFGGAVGAWEKMSHCRRASTNRWVMMAPATGSCPPSALCSWPSMVTPARKGEMIIVVNSSAFRAMRASVGVVEIFLAARYCLMPSPAPA